MPENTAQHQHEAKVQQIANALALSYGSHAHAPKGGKDWKAAEDLFPLLDAIIGAAQYDAWEECLATTGGTAPNPYQQFRKLTEDFKA